MSAISLFKTYDIYLTRPGLSLDWAAEIKEEPNCLSLYLLDGRYDSTTR